MTQTVKAACVQLQCNSDAVRNWETSSRLIREAAQAGAELVVTPENTTFLGPHAQKVALAEPLDGPTPVSYTHLTLPTIYSV